MVAFPKAIRESVHEGEMKIKLKNGSLWQVVGSDNYHSLVGTPPCGLVFSEWARAVPRILRLFESNPDGQQRVGDLYQHAVR